MRTPSLHQSLLRDRLELLYQTYGAETAASDPIVFLPRYEDPEDREVVGWIASAFAYGRVETILDHVGGLLEILGSHPARTLDKVRDFRRLVKARLSGFRHRFHSGQDVGVLLYAIAQARARSGCLRAFFEEEIRSEERDVAGLLSRVVAKIETFDYRPVLGRRTIPRTSPARFFFPDPARGSACKRWNLYLRWMVRRDRLDHGLWPGIPTDHLVIPTDTHVHLVSRRLGLTRRRTPDWKTAREITDSLARFDPDDPVRFDYALCHIGIFGVCRPQLAKSRCHQCLAHEACPAGRRRISRGAEVPRSRGDRVERGLSPAPLPLRTSACAS